MVQVTGVSIPAMSTIGYGTGVTEDGKPVTFVGDHRPMRELGEVIAATVERDDLPMVELEDWQVTG